MSEQAGSSLWVENRERGGGPRTGGRGAHWHRGTQELQVSFPGCIPPGRREVTPIGEQEETAQPRQVQIYELEKTKNKGYPWP